ncbi:hypothetical protein PspLS_09977 [Pyricularia sp. CBS 133598]|nr:hypothetical protein PspLS_09977 [Pyricularia sp. CBS 133598]
MSNGHYLNSDGEAEPDGYDDNDLHFSDDDDGGDDPVSTEDPIKICGTIISRLRKRKVLWEEDPNFPDIPALPSEHKCHLLGVGAGDMGSDSVLHFLAKDGELAKESPEVVKQVVQFILNESLGQEVLVDF